MTLSEALDLGVSQLHSNPRLRDDAAQDAAYLLRHTLAISQAGLLANPERQLTPEEQAAYQALITRRLTHEPIQYITGEREFYGLPLRVTPAVLIPRNATEHLVEAVLQELGCHPAAQRRDLLLYSQTAPLRIADVGTGSGAIAIALAHHLPNAQITALDLSPAALEVAASNAALNSVAARIRFLESDLLSSVPHSSQSHRDEWENKPFDAIVSNPPYIPLADRDSLHPQVRDYEPEVSLYGGPTGLDIYRRLIPQAHAALKSNGLLAMEIGYGQSTAILDLLTGWNSVRLINDLEQIPRVVLARKP